MRSILRCTASIALTLAALPATAEIPLYPTGPAEDASFVRFVNAGAQPVTVQASGGQRLELPANRPASQFFPVAAGKPVAGSLVRGAQRATIDVKVAPGEFATVVGLDGSDAKGGLATVLVRETPDEFNAARAALGFVNLDAGCAHAALNAAGREIAIFKDAPLNQPQRRLVNPVALSVQLICAGAPRGEPLVLGTLAAGERYTVFAASSAAGTRVFHVTDSLAP